MRNANRSNVANKTYQNNNQERSNSSYKKNFNKQGSFNGRKGGKPQVKKKFVPRTYERKVPVNEFGKNLYEYVTRLFTVKDNQAYPHQNTYSASLFDALKEVKLIDKSIKRIKFKSTPKNEVVGKLKSLNDLHARKKSLLSIIAKTNIDNTIEVKIGDNEVKMTMFAARMQVKEMAQYANRFKDSAISIDGDNTESIVKEIESVIIDIEAELQRVSKEIFIQIPR